MNKELKVLNNKAIVVDENKKEKELTLTNNLEEILIVENNIEVIKNELEKMNFECNHVTKKNQIIKFINAIGIAFITTICLILGISNIIFFIIMPFLLATNIGVCGYIFNKNKEYKNKLKLQESILDEAFIKESQKLKNLHIISKKIKNIENETKKINTSNLVKCLKRKLRIIKNYENDRSFYMYLYYNYQLGDALSEMGYSKDEFNLVVYLIQNDLENKKERKNNKTLIKK